MKLLLTSAGLTNQGLSDEFIRLAGKDNPVVAFVATAAGLEEDQGWVEEVRQSIRLAGGSIVETDLSRLDQSQVAENCEGADVIWLNGGNNYYLVYWMRKSGLAEMLPSLLEDKVYVGVSAGSMVLGCSMSLTETYFPDELTSFAKAVSGDEVQLAQALGWLDFAVLPHYLAENSYFPELHQADAVEVKAELFEYPIYALSDGRAILVDGDRVEVVGVGEWKLLGGVRS